MIKHKTAPFLFIVGTIFAVLLFDNLKALFGLSSYSVGFDPRNLIVLSGYFVWISWLYLTFSKRGTKTNMILWGLTIVHTLAMLPFYAWAFIFVIPYVVWHIITLIVAYHSIKKDWHLFQVQKKLTKASV